MLASQNTIRACDSRFHMWGVGQHGNHNIGVCSHILVALFSNSAACNNLLNCRGNNVVNVHFVACLKQVFGHRSSHGAQTNKSDFHCSVLQTF